MFISFEEFEKVINQCSEVFGTWDDEYDKLQGLMRDIVKRKRDEHLKMVWRVNFSHKRLQVFFYVVLLLPAQSLLTDCSCWCRQGSSR